MKKFLTLTIIAIIALIGLSVSVNAAEVVSDEAGLRAQLEAGNSVELSSHIEGITTNSTTTLTSPAKRTVGVAIKGEGKITIDGNGKTVSSDTLDVLFEIYTDSELTVIFKDITIVAKTRAIDIRKPGISIELDNAEVQVVGTGNTQALTVGGPSGPINVTITNGSIVKANDAGYAIVTFNPVNMIIENSVIEGYAALYFKGPDGSLGSSGSIVTVEKSELNGVNSYSGKNDDFGAVVFEEGGVDLEIIDSKINSKGNGTASQSAFLESNFKVPTFSAKNTINISGDTVINAKDDIFATLDNDNENDNIEISIEAGVKSNKDLTEYLPEGSKVEKDENDKYVVYQEHDIIIEVSEGGKVTLNKESAFVGEVIKLEVMPVEGYRLKSIKGADDLTDVAEYAYEFTMLDKDVTITVEFEKIPVEDEEKPTTGEGTTTQEPEKDEKDNTPETGSVDVVLFASTIVAVVSLAGIVMVKKYTK